MSQGVQLDELYAALEALLKANLTGAPAVAVQPLTAESISTEEQTLGKIIARPPAVLLALQDASFDTRNDHTATEYNASFRFMALCGAASLRDSDEQRTGALALLGRVANILAGARLTLASAGNKLQCVLERVGLAQLEADGTWYGLQFTVRGPSQFGGVAL